jgi:general secretion pathway protein A
MADPKILTQYGLKYDPFSPAIPPEDLWEPPDAARFFFRVESAVLDGGFALITGEPGLGKSKVLHRLRERLLQIGELKVGVMERPQSTLGDFYRELGDIFSVNLTPTNRYGGFKALRARWKNHISTTLMHPVLLVDEAQEAENACLNELRLLGSANFDSECLLTTVLCADSRLTDRFRTRDLLPLGSRVRTRLALKPYSRSELRDFLEHILERAGAPHLMTDPLRDALVEHAGGNLRVLTGMGSELLAAGAAQSRPALDDQLFLELYGRQTRTRKIAQ